MKRKSLDELDYELKVQRALRKVFMDHREKGSHGDNGRIKKHIFMHIYAYYAYAGSTHKFHQTIMHLLINMSPEFRPFTTGIYFH